MPTIEPSASNSTPRIFSDEELTMLALAADPDVTLEPDAVPWHWYGELSENLLPEWYMARPSASRHGRGTRVVVGTIVATMVVICATGLCVTSGFLQIA